MHIPKACCSYVGGGSQSFRPCQTVNTEQMCCLFVCLTGYIVFTPRHSLKILINDDNY